MLTLEGFLLGIRRLLGVSLFAMPFGLAFGAAAVQAGMPPAQAIVMSLTVFAGASQFAMLDLWHHPLPMLSIAFVALAVNARHIVFGAVLAQLVNALPVGRRVLATVFLSDANFADMQAARRSGLTDLGVLAGGGFLLWFAWVIGTVLGVLAGGAAADLSRFGIDVVMAAFFVTVIAGSVRGRSKLLPVGVAALVSVLGLHLLPQGWNVIAGALAGGLAGMLRDPGVARERS